VGRTRSAPARRSRPAWPAALTVLAALVLVMFGVAVSLAIIGHTGAGLSFIALPAALLGLLIARRQPGNRIAWVLLAFSAAFAFYGDAAGYSVWDYRFHGGRLPLGPTAVVIASELWVLVFLVLPLVILLFPDGQLPPRWRRVMGAYLAVCALIVAIQVAAGTSQVRGTRIVVTDKGQLVNNPGPTGVLGLAFIVLLLAVAVFWVSFVARQVLSWRRATGERRAQLKWLMAGGTATLAGLAGTFLFAQFSGPLVTVIDSIMLAVGIFSLPVCIALAILKYHLYDIDRLISRTVSYTLVTGLLIGVYAGVVTFATHVLPFTSPVGVAASTLAVAALFSPLRRRVQRMVDHRFNRARYDADQTVTAFASRLKDAVDLDSIQDDLAAAVHRTLEPAHISVWLSPEAGRPASYD
jgi:hypothetical protein